MTKGRRLDRKDYRILLVSAVGFAAAVLLCTHFTLPFGSSLDWSSQHFLIPDYFRKLFYETGELIPSFAPNLGAGENIWCLSYYGLLSPVILLSYLLPFVRMSVYIQVSSAVLCWLGAALLYRFARRRETKRRAALMMLSYLSAAPIFLHAHRHIMFISYMPFLILAFEAVNLYFESRSKWQLTLWSFLIIMTSWFFSVSALLAVAAYGVYRYLSLNDKFSISDFVKTGAAFAGRILAAVMMAAVLLLPTLYALTSGRDPSSNSDFELIDLIPAPRFELSGLTPYSYGLGSAVFLAVMSAVLSKKTARRFLGIVLSLLIFCPVTVWLLNGMMYADGKVLIPFIPLILILCSDMLDEIRAGELKKTALLLTAAAFALGMIFSKNKGNELFIVIGMSADFALLAAAAALYLKKSFIHGFTAALFLFPFVTSVVLTVTDPEITLEQMDYLEADRYEKLCSRISSDGQLWRSAVAERRIDTVNIVPTVDFYSPYIYSSIHHKGYNSFYFNTFNNENEYRNSALTTRSQNPLFDIFMGTKYLLSESEERVPYFYEQTASDGSMKLFENPCVQPVGRVLPTLGEDVFAGLSSAEKMEALIRRVIVGRGGSFESTVSKERIIKLPENGKITRMDGESLIGSEEPFELELPLGFSVPEDRLLVLELNCDNTFGRRRDVKLTINGVSNKLTSPDWKYYNKNTLFTYVLSAPEGGLDTLSLRFSAGEYRLTDIRACTVAIPTDAGECDALSFDPSSKGDEFSGRINCTKEGCFLLTFPYDKGFELTLDGKPQEYECVDKTFIGFPIGAGEHTLTVRYTAPWLREGKLLSAAGFALFAALIVTEKVKRHKGDKNGKR